MPDVKISAGADPGALTATDKVPLARSASTTAYAATMAELASYANGAYTPPWYAGSPAMDGVASAGTAAFVTRGDHVHPSDTSRLPLAGGTMAGFLTLNANPTANLHAATKQYVDGSAPVGGPYVAIANLHDVGRNLLHNPLFNVAQRGAGPFTANGYTLDRWTMFLGGDTASVGQQPFVAGSMPLDEAAANALANTFTGSAAAAAQIVVFQYVEDVRRLANKTVTVSFCAICASGALKFGVSLDQYFGTGGSPSAVVFGNGQSVTLSPTWTRYSLTFTLPTVNGKTLGTAGDHKTALNLFYSSGATNATRAGNIGVQSGTIYVWGVQLEIGSIATPLEKPDPRYDLANCQRFYQTGNMWISGWVGAGAIGITALSNLPVTLRGTPAMTTNVTSSANVTGTAVVSYGLGAVVIQSNSSASGGFIAQASYTASADL